MMQQNLDLNIKIEDNLFSLDFEKEGGIHLDENNNIIRDKGVVKDCYVCVRPGNKFNVPKVVVDKDGCRYIANNYGHGGIGWSTLWGSVNKSINMLEEKGVNLKEKKIAVLGGGCMGCATVLMLLEKGVDPKNIEIICEDTVNIASNRSGAMLSSASMLETLEPNIKKLFDDIQIDSFLMWEQIHKGKRLKKLQEAILDVKAYFGAEDEWGTIHTDSGLDVFVEKGLMPKPELVYVKFGDKYNKMNKYDCYYFNTYKLMKAFYDIIENDNKIRITKKRIESFSEINSSFNVVFNCTGLGNQTHFKKDPDIHPIGGHIITLKNQEIHKFNYVLYSHYICQEDVGKYNYTNAPLFYFMLKTDGSSYGGLLGGSLMGNYAGGDSLIDEKEFKGVMRRTLEIFGNKTHLEKVKTPSKNISMTAKF